MKRKSLVLAVSCFSFVFASSYSSFGAIVVTDIDPVTVTGGVAVNFNLNPGASGSLDSVDDIFIFVTDFGADGSLLTAAGLSSNTIAVESGSALFEAVQFQAGNTIGASQTFGGSAGDSPPTNSRLATEGFGSTGPWSGGNTGYLGVNFDISGEEHFGFVRISWQPDAAVAVIDQVGFQDIAGADVTVVPEPSSILLLSLVGGGAILRRRR